MLLSDDETSDKGNGEPARRVYKRVQLCQYSDWEPGGPWTNIHACGTLIPSGRRNQICWKHRAEILAVMPKYS